MGLVRNPETESISNIKRYLDEQKGIYFYFRTQALQMQKRFINVHAVGSTPIVFLHGNPHIDNYARTGTGCGMIDFDRSRMGPYSWDLVRLMSSLMMLDPKQKNKLDKGIKEAIFEGYHSRIVDPSLSYKTFSPLMKKKPQEWQLSTKAYLNNNKRWAKKMRANAIDSNDERIMTLFKGYVESRRKFHFLDMYEVDEAGICYGSMGKMRFIVSLKPRKKVEDYLLLDIKEVYEDPDTDNFYNPYKNHGHRMVEASQLYAPGVEQRIGYSQLAGQQYWVRQVPSLQMKIKSALTPEEAAQFSYCVATQLGLGHQRSLLFADPDNLAKHLKENYNQYVKIAEKLSDEIVEAFEEYKALVKEQVSDLGEVIGAWG